MKILLLEDDILLGETLEEMLTEAHYDIHWVKDGEEAAEASFDTLYDLYILDINVPKINGFQLLEELRAAGDNTRVIFISAMSDMASISKGFRLGADDYLKKPFFPEELLVRIDAKFTQFQKVIQHGEITFNPQNNEVHKEGRLITLGDVQLPMLRLFIQNIGRTLTKESLFDLMEHPSDSALRVAINKLKTTTNWEIQNVRAVGYRLEAR
ncbi:MAG: response regulator transcription factor [Campylobacterales bacterium]|nr:response regulator transcription factor [Campylobacterales bacterium]